MPTNEFETVDPEALEQVAGGRVSSRAGGSNDQLTAMLTQITGSIKELANQPSGGMDPMMLMMMMMMGGGGGGGGVAAAPAAATSVAATPVVNVEAAIGGGGRGKGKKGW